MMTEAFFLLLLFLFFWLINQPKPVNGSSSQEPDPIPPAPESTFVITYDRFDVYVMNDNPNAYYAIHNDPDTGSYIRIPEWGGTVSYHDILLMITWFWGQGGGAG